MLHRPMMVALAPWLLCHVAAADIAYVAESSPGGDGTSWETAYRHLQDALDAANEPGSDIDEVRVAAGTYSPDEGAGQTADDPDATFLLADGLTVSGGYAGPGASDPDEWDPLVYVTVLDGFLTDTGSIRSRHVVSILDRSVPVTLSGMVVRGGDAGGGLGGGVLCDNASLVVSWCRFIENDAEYGAGVYVRDGDVVAEDCCFEDNTASFAGGGLRARDGDVEITRCVFRWNTADVGGGVRVDFGEDLTIRECTLSGNVADVAGAASIRYIQNSVVEDCRFLANAAPGGGGGAIHLIGTGTASLTRCDFEDNVGGSGGAVIFDDSESTIVDCLFARNEADFHGGGVLDASATSTYVNCVFSRNIGGSLEGGGALLVTIQSRLVNCSIAGSVDYAVATTTIGEATIENSILWNNSPSHFGGTNNIDYEYCNVEGAGSSGTNIDADPLFVQAGSDDLRLGIGSPCIDVGNIELVPPGIVTDHGGAPRFQGVSVDMGAFEGEYEVLPAMAFEDDIANDETVYLIPTGLIPDPFEHALAIVWNASGPDGSYASLTQYETAIHPAAQGHTEISSILSLATSIEPGAHLSRVFIPFGAADLGGANPASMRVTSYDPVVGNWRVAVAGNSQDSPGGVGRIGRRYVSIDETPTVTTTLGDYGVVWVTDEQRGYVWANVDVEGDFGVGAPLCVNDCHQTPDGMVSVDDLVALLHAWGNDGLGPCDIDQDGTVGVLDLVALLDAWGICP